MRKIVAALVVSLALGGAAFAAASKDQQAAGAEDGVD